MELLVDFAAEILAVILLSVLGFATGWLGSRSFLRGMASRLTDFDYRLTDAEGKLVRETKIRANMISKSAKDRDAEIIALAQSTPQGNGATNLADWRQKAFQR